MRGVSHWGLGYRRFDNMLRFIAFSVLHLLTYLANVVVLVYLIYYLVAIEDQTHYGKVAYAALLFIAQLIVGLYCTHLALGDRNIKMGCLYACGGSHTAVRYLCCVVLGLTQLIQLKVAYDKYTRREEMPRDVESDDEEDDPEQGRIPDARRAAIVEHRIPWAFPSKCFEGIFEGCVFALVLLYAVLKIGWEDDGVFNNLWSEDFAYAIALLSGVGSFCTVGISMLNFDYHLSPAVQKTVDHSMRYTILHAFFRSCEAGVRVAMVVIGALAFRSCSSWLVALPYMVLVIDYVFGVGMLVWLSAGEENQYESLNSCQGYFKRIFIAMLTGFLLLVSNLAEFVDEADRTQLRQSARTYSRAFRWFRFVELIAVLVTCFATPCTISLHQSDSIVHVSLFNYLVTKHKLIGIAVLVAIMCYYIMVLLSFHSIAVDDMDGVAIRAVLKLPGSNDVNRSSINSGTRRIPLLDESAPEAILAHGEHASIPEPALSESVPVNQAMDSDLPLSLREDLVSDGTFYHASQNEYCIARAPSLSFLLLSKGIHGSVANMVLTRIDENEALPSDNVVRTDRVKMSDFVLDERLGSGAYASVWKCRKKSTGEVFAMKRLVKNNYVRRKGAEAEFPRRERDALFLAGRHANVAYLDSAFETESYWVLITELCELGSLTRHIKRLGGGLPADEAKIMSAQVLAGLQHLHSHFILHRDIKPDNVGLGGSRDAPIAKIIDFGFAKRAETKQSSTILGSYGYCAPEIDTARRFYGALKQAQEVHDERVDIYSYGVLVFVIFVGREAITDGPYKALWSHEQFRAMLLQVNNTLWTCAHFVSKRIDGNVLLNRMRDCCALEAISRLTETDPNNRTRTCAEAFQLRFYTEAQGAGSLRSSESSRDSFDMQA